MTINTIAVVGAGTMGEGIAQSAAAAGCHVYLVEINQHTLDKAVESLKNRFSRLAEKEKMTTTEALAAWERIQPRTAIENLTDATLAIEAVVERLDIKRNVFQQLARACATGAILATNTSSLPVADIAETTPDPSRVIGMHFFNPVPLMPLVEIIAGPQSKSQHLDSATEVSRKWGKTPVRAKDTPGFIVNRVARGFYLEALRMLEENIAGVEQIDRTMRDLGGFRMGPFQLMDLVGLDVNYAVSQSVWQQSGNPARLTPHPIQGQLVEQKKLGRKTGQGFYNYDNDPPKTAYPDLNLPAKLSSEAIAIAKEFTRKGALISASDTENYIFARILAAIINEAHLALDDNVATSADVDTAMKLGTNYPKGPIDWSHMISQPLVTKMLNQLNKESTDNRFTPAKSLQ
jgi:3-hydroxybutyryl-CoA dehydrogenase